MVPRNRWRAIIVDIDRLQTQSLTKSFTNLNLNLLIKHRQELLGIDRRIYGSSYKTLRYFMNPKSEGSEFAAGLKRLGWSLLAPK